MKVGIDPRRFVTYSFPKITVLVTTSWKGKPNVFTVAWHTPVSFKPPFYCISVSPRRYSHDLIARSGEFTVNFPDFELVAETHRCGRVSGRDGDKFALTGLTPIPARVVKAPIIKECYAHMECRVVRRMTAGDHSLFVGEVVAVQADRDAFENGLVERARPVFYLGKDVYTTMTKKRREFKRGSP